MRSITLQFLSGLLTGLLAAAVVLVAARRAPGHPVELPPPATLAPVRVYVSGAVAAPGVYRLAPGGIWQDALAAAGGALPQADLNQLNLAQAALDGDQVDVPASKPSATPTPPKPTATPKPTRVPGTPAPTASPPASGPINLNTATLAELDSLPGIGPSIAQRILDYRAQHGPFAKVADLTRVKGIGPALLEKIKDLVVVGP